MCFSFYQTHYFALDMITSTQIPKFCVLIDPSCLVKMLTQVANLVGKSFWSETEKRNHFLSGNGLDIPRSVCTRMQLLFSVAALADIPPTVWFSSTSVVSFDTWRPFKIKRTHHVGVRGYVRMQRSRWNEARLLSVFITTSMNNLAQTSFVFLKRRSVVRIVHTCWASRMFGYFFIRHNNQLFRPTYNNYWSMSVCFFCAANWS